MLHVDGVQMRILVVHNAGPRQYPSGELVVAQREIKELKARGVEVRAHVVSNDDMSSRLDMAIAGLSLIWSPRSFRQMTNLLREYRPHVVHVHTILPLLTVSILSACKREKIPVVQTVHNYRWFCIEGGFYDSTNSYCEDCLQRGPWRGVVKRCAKRSALGSALLTLNNAVHVKTGNLMRLMDRFLAISEFVLDKHVEAGFPREKMLLKYNGVYLPGATGTAPPAERKGLTFAGRLVHARGVPILKGIIPLLPDVPINILGHGPHSEELQQFCEQGGHKHVTLFGKVSPDKVYSMMSNAACVLVPTLHAEGFGLAAVEALACRTPVVASRNGSLVEIVGKSGGGVNVAGDNPADYAAAIREIVTDPARIGAMGERGRKYAEKHFAMDSAMDRLLEIYDELARTAGN